MDLTAVEICAAEFQILLVEFTFSHCRFTPRTGVRGSAWLPPECLPESFITTQNMSVVNQLFQFPS